MATQDLHAFLSRFSAEPGMRHDLHNCIALLPHDADLTAASAEFALAHGYKIDMPDLLALDTVLEPLRSHSPARVVRTLEVFALDYLKGCHDPTKYNAQGYYDPQDQQLWRVF